MSIPTINKPDLDPIFVLSEPSTSFDADLFMFKNYLRYIEIPDLYPFQLKLFEKYFIISREEETIAAQREKFQNLMESRLITLSNIIAPEHVLELRYLLMRGFDETLNNRNPIFQLLDRWIDKKLISLECGIEISKFVEISLFGSFEEEKPPLSICGSPFSEKLLAVKGRALLQDDHITLFSKVFEAISTMHGVDPREEFYSFLNEFLFCITGQNRAIKEFHIDRLKNSLVLQERACTGQLLESISERKGSEISLTPPIPIERCRATPKHVITSARYWYIRIFEETLLNRDPYSCFLDFLFDQGCISFKLLERLWSATQQVNTLLGHRVGQMKSRAQHKLEMLEIHIGSRFERILQSEILPLKKQIMINLFSHFSLFACPDYLSCLIQLIKESAQKLKLNPEESIQLFKSHFKIGSDDDLYLLQSSFPIDALLRFNKFFNQNLKRSVSICSNLDQKQLLCLIKGYIEGGTAELEKRLLEVNLDSKTAEEFLSFFTS